MDTNRPPFSDPHATGDAESMIRFARLIGSAVLLLIGISIAGWVAATIFSVFASEQTPGLVTAMMPGDEDDATLKVPEGAFVVPAAAFRVAGYLVLCFLLAIAASIAAVFVTQGVNLLQPNLSEILRKLYTHVASSDGPGGDHR